jgi:hypothetical protein
MPSFSRFNSEFAEDREARAAHLKKQKQAAAANSATN